jgi:membrane protease YdiL (CAAX protease family)
MPPESPESPLSPEPIPVPEVSPKVRIADRLMAVTEIILCSSLPTQFVVAMAVAALGVAPRTPAGELSLRFIMAVTLADTVLLIGLMVFFTRQRGESPAALWLGSRRIGPEAIHGLMLVPIVFALVILTLGILRVAAPWLHNVEVNPLESLARGGTVNAVLFGVVVIVAGGVREELARAFLLQRFERYLGGMTVGIVVLSAGFGLGHVNQGWDAVITTGMLGAFWAVVYARRRSSVAPVVSHAGFNSMEVVRIVVTGA